MGRWFCVGRFVGRAFVLLVFFPVVSPAIAQTFAEAVDLARSNEPGYLAARAGLDAARGKSGQAFSGLLPQLSASVATNDNRRSYFTRDVPLPPEIGRFNGSSAQVTLTQPLWRHANLIGASQADALVAQAEFQVVSTEQELLARLVGAWFETMQARDAMLYAGYQAAAAKAQWATMQRAASLGAATVQAREDARAKHEQALAERVTAEMDLKTRVARLEQIVGPLPDFLPPFLTGRFQAPVLDRAAAGRDTLDVWLDAVEQANPGIMAASRALAAAEREVDKQTAGHEPTLDLVGNYTRSSQSAGNFPGQSGYDIRQSTIGFQLTVPLFSGGGQSARIGESLALQEKARQGLEAARRVARLAAKEAWYGWLSGNARERAALQAVRSADLALKAATTGKATGLNVALDLLQASQQLAAARRELNRARYDVLLSAFRLKAAAGCIEDADVAQLAALFVPREPDMREILAEVAP